MPSVILAYVMTPANDTCGSLHIDPPYGSNWQFLCTGAKVWWALDPRSGFSLPAWTAARDTAAEAGSAAGADSGVGMTRNFSGPDAGELLALHTAHDVHTTRLAPGDFVSVPLAWPHWVATPEWSLGVSGYAETPAQHCAATARQDALNA